MTWSELHSKSERIAIEAQLALKARNTKLAIDLYNQAAEFERQALEALDVSKIRTRGITAVSAVALWFKAGEYVNAEQLAYSMLADRNIPDFACEGLRNLVQAYLCLFFKVCSVREGEEAVKKCRIIAKTEEQIKSEIQMLNNGSKSLAQHRTSPGEFFAEKKPKCTQGSWVTSGRSRSGTKASVRSSKTGARSKRQWRQNAQ